MYNIFASRAKVERNISGLNGSAVLRFAVSMAKAVSKFLCFGRADLLSNSLAVSQADSQTA